ncbi:Hsp20/alpha crystallin family protein [Anaerocolumna sp. MB42-C2]|uniref:Hsp20/alpha crystallin family protein n=1 Tax=Anaerocolumna sp. MB42-C2 TaxID=3070997 RepID=UPI0027E03A80|nr:Hsp20/alpha crystallin family protein [Anaerocolumna sp. MB42-C2]WMJ87857.1 Hsp20/alpha crystallin family protein [Anaerocolumna sp. MB42-C2]
MLRPMLFEQTQPLLFSKLYNDFFGDLMNRFDSFSTDVIDKGDHYLLQAEMPGFKKDEINIDLDNDTLSITANHKEESKEEKDNYIRQERHYNSYSRSFSVSGINKDNISASYNNGILELKLPKENAEIVENKRIEIQ